jgi:hypothetical protein
VSQCVMRTTKDRRGGSGVSSDTAAGTAADVTEASIPKLYYSSLAAVRTNRTPRNAHPQTRNWVIEKGCGSSYVFPYQHCCEQMKMAVADPDIPIVYTPKFREYGVRVLDGGSSTLGFMFCPWCGQRLPESLRDVWFDELERRGIDPADGNIPAEFSDETWYHMREGH